METYLSLITPALKRAGHEVAFWHETDEPSNRERIALPEDVATWCVEELGTERALHELRAWQPDLLYAHSLQSPALEAATLEIAPAIFFAHDYRGTCISGLKTFKNPTVTPCARRFGWQCLLHYYPHRCGGWSPLTMMRLYRVQSERLKVLRGYRAILTNSLHMRAEYVKHGFPAGRVYTLAYYVHRGDGGGDGNAPHESPADVSRASDAVAARTREETPYQLLFIGRMDLLKGGSVFVESLARVTERLPRPVRVTFIGDGPVRAAWERKAARTQNRNRKLRIDFTGWLERDQLGPHLDACDLLVFPSLWPEPFGLVGPEAGLHGVPVAAFAVGGVPDWLVDGVNGFLAPGDPPTADGLAESIVKCLADPDVHARLRRGAVEIAQRFSLEIHLGGLTTIFNEVVHPDSQKASGRSY